MRAAATLSGRLGVPGVLRNGFEPKLPPMAFTRKGARLRLLPLLLLLCRPWSGCVNLLHLLLFTDLNDFGAVCAVTPHPRGLLLLWGILPEDICSWSCVCMCVLVCSYVIVHVCKWCVDIRAWVQVLVLVCVSIHLLTHVL